MFGNDFLLVFDVKKHHPETESDDRRDYRIREKIREYVIESNSGGKTKNAENQNCPSGSVKRPVKCPVTLTDGQIQI